MPALLSFSHATSAALVAAAAVAGAPAAHAQALAGQVTFAIGEAHVGGGQALKAGDAVLVGQVIETGKAGHVHLKLVDGAFLSVRPQSRLRVEAYDYNAAAPEASRVKYMLEDGAARSITGRAGQANKAGFRFNTPVAAIGIRGTDFVVQTTPSVTRAAVNSGRIVMSGFGENCSPAALGPCGNGVAELGVIDGVRNSHYLEVRANQVRPVLVPAQTGSDALMPRREAAPAEAAPAVPVGADVRAAASTAEVVPQTVALDLANSVQQALKPATVLWGRWSVYEGGDADRPTAAQLLARPDLELQQANTGFALFTTREPLAMPETGRFSFSLVDSEAYIQAGRQLEAARVSRGSLDVNFSDRSFATGLTVSAGSLPVSLGLQASGSVGADGSLNGSSGNMDVRGALQGDATQAGYLFRSPLDAGRVAVGAVRWVR